MNIKGIITGDIISSSTIKLEWRDILLISIQETVEELKQISPLKIEFFRGDSFQIIIDNPEDALKIAILFRAGLKSKTPKGSKKTWDARLSIGIGSISYSSDKILVSDGEAFLFSGRELDEIGKRKLNIKTRWEDINDELKVSTAFADDIISKWSISQAQVIYLALLHRTPQREIALQINKTTQNISKLLATAKENLIGMYLERYHLLISKQLQK